MVQIRERRRFIRHPICYPVEYEYAPRKIVAKTNTINVSKGGLLFLSKHRLQPGKVIILKLPIKDNVVRVRAKVMHIEPDEEDPKLFNVGVSFYRYSDAFRVKLVEQIYLIDEYRRLRSVQVGHDVSFKQASSEWIKRYAKRFSKLYW